MSICREYILGLSMEVQRKELPKVCVFVCLCVCADNSAILSPQANFEQQKRQCEVFFSPLKLLVPDLHVPFFRWLLTSLIVTFNLFI